MALAGVAPHITIRPGEFEGESSMVSTWQDPGSSPSLHTAEALGIECVFFGVAPGVVPSGKPPVRIFLGTEEAQQRAERVFLYTIRKFRDPARVYRVYLLQDLRGFDRGGWRTGFTQYRFAIPELAGGCGRAIYNDVDQIYLADPASLFDVDLEGYGYRAVAANDTSVMVMDCARMLPWWNLGTAQSEGKRALVEAPAAEPGLWGRLDGGWNARDFEFRPGRSHLLHYTTLHLQPWRPTPQKYSYHPHPIGSLWLRLEREADVQRYQPFTREHPSAAYRALRSEGRAPLVPAPAEAVSVQQNLEHLPPRDRAWFLDALFAVALRSLALRVDLRQAMRDEDALRPRRAAAESWWRDGLAEAGERRPGVAWELEIVEPAGSRRFAYRPGGGPPRVWVMLGRHEGDNRQLLTLAAALDWPYQTRRLAFKRRRLVPTWLLGGSRLLLDRDHSDPLTPPWPDVVLASGRRTAPIVRWIQQRSQGAARLVHLGRPQAPLAAFDLVVTTPQYALPGRANVVHNVLPLNRPRAPIEAALSAWLPQLEPLPHPWIALLVGGKSSSSVLDEASARRLREQAEAHARACGGSLLVATSPRTPTAAADILLGESDVPGLRYRWRAGDAANPYPLFLARADDFIVTADSASMVAEACASGRPVHYFVLPRPLPRLTTIKRVRRRLVHWLFEARPRVGERGTPKQQDRWVRWLDALVVAGILRVPLDLDALQAALRWSGLAQPLGDSVPLKQTAAAEDMERTVRAVRLMLLRGRPTSPGRA
jgi:mitochondrial fission protein ELM1